jgi:ribose-phosphate pyrophosphokinase
MVAPVALPRNEEVKSSGLNDRLRIFSGSANVGLADEIAHYLNRNLGAVDRKRFADGETYIQFQESIRGCDVYLIQPTCRPVNDHLVELMIMIDACKRASARYITAVVPYYGYSRADRQTAGRESITAKLAANLITQSGASRVLAMDLHSNQIQGYFDIPIDHLSSTSSLRAYLLQKNLTDIVVVSPDIGGVARARAFAKLLNDAPLVIADKRKQAYQDTEVVNIIGNVRGKTAIIIDDIIDTANTISDCAKALKSAGSRQIYACATHAVFSKATVEKLSNSCFEEVIVFNTIPVPTDYQFKGLTVLSAAEIFGKAINGIHKKNPIDGGIKIS